MNAEPALPRVLIINGDDFGLSPGVNAGIAEAFDRGVLTSATLLANGPCFEEAVSAARERLGRGLGVGVHLNIVRGRPLSPVGEVSRLVDGDGRFVPFRMRRLTGGFLTEAVAEYRRQIERVLATGLSPTHIDFEKHHAWQGGLYRAACMAAREYGIRAARSLREPVAWSVRRLGWPGTGKCAEAALLRTGVGLGGAGSAGTLCGLRCPDRLLGQCHIGGMTESVWLSLLKHLPAGISEVMVHPGTDSGGEGGMGASWIEGMREAELAALLSPGVREAIREGGIRLGNFSAALFG